MSFWVLLGPLDCLTARVYRALFKMANTEKKILDFHFCINSANMAEDTLGKLTYSALASSPCSSK